MNSSHFNHLLEPLQLLMMASQLYNSSLLKDNCVQTVQSELGLTFPRR